MVYTTRFILARQRQVCPRQIGQKSLCFGGFVWLCPKFADIKTEADICLWQVLILRWWFSSHGSIPSASFSLTFALLTFRQHFFEIPWQKVDFRPIINFLSAKSPKKLTKCWTRFSERIYTNELTRGTEPALKTSPQPQINIPARIHLPWMPAGIRFNIS